jgi:hypothetical protein
MPTTITCSGRPAGGGGRGGYGGLDRAHARGAGDEDAVDRPILPARRDLGHEVDVHVRAVGLELAMARELGEQGVAFLFEGGDEEEIDRGLSWKRRAKGGIGGPLTRAPRWRGSHA